MARVVAAVDSDHEVRGLPGRWRVQQFGADRRAADEVLLRGARRGAGMTRSLDHPLVAASTLTCFACPELHEGTLVTGESFYFRYRHGRASLTVDGARGSGRAEMEVGDSLQGVFSSPGQREQVLAELLGELVAGGTVRS